MQIFRADRKASTRDGWGMPRSSAPSSWAAYAPELGLELQRRRIAAGFTQEDLAHQAGLTRTHYQQIDKASGRLTSRPIRR
jgi:hypothetical protein